MSAGGAPAVSADKVIDAVTAPVEKALNTVEAFENAATSVRTGETPNPADAQTVTTAVVEAIVAEVAQQSQQEENLDQNAPENQSNSDGRVQKRDEKGRFVSDPDNPPHGNQYTSSDRRRDWKNEAENPSRSDYSEEDMERMGQGAAPVRINPETGEQETMERHHAPTPLRDGGKETVPVWPPEHAEVDPHRRLKKQPPPPPPPDPNHRN